MQNLLKPPARAVSRRKKLPETVIPALPSAPVAAAASARATEQKHKPAAPVPERSFRSRRSLEHDPRPAIRHQDSVPVPKIANSETFKRYLAHLPTLILSLIGFGLLTYLLTHLYPAQLANIIVPQLYLPVLLLFWISSFLGLSYLFLHSRRGAHWALCLTLLLWLKLQGVLTFPILLLISSVFLASELILTLSRQ